MASDMRAIQPESLYKLYLECQERPDGRRLDEARPTVLNRGGVGTADGSAYCRAGHTAVLCGIKAELPLAATLALFDGDTLVLDPAGEEEALCAAAVTVAWAGDNLLLLHKAGGHALSEQAMDQCIALSKRRTLELKKLLDVSADAAAEGGVVD
ncbi:exosome complex component RRP43-like [Pollicipes pollicipes]|uniref:exosome complex component RRP43-like n=1 Tax=Pollicipes pollicipes TaxID=41117 RepID=UPI00188565EC|nr:exosome complex component RRP43-like [Pollicipes pollicipes]